MLSAALTLRIKMNALLIVFFLSSLITASLAKELKNEVYFQVMSQDPHHLKVITPHMKSISKQGRLWIVTALASMPRNGFKYLRKLDNKDLASVTHYLYRPSVKDLGRRNQEIVQRIKLLDLENIKNQVVQLSSYNSRAAGSVENVQVTKSLKESFQKLGFAVSEICYQPNRCSIIADRLGQKFPKEVTLLMAHFDSVGKSFAGSDDNASGTAVMMEVARVLSTYDNKKTLRFFATNGEELGLLGAAHYVKHLETTGELASVKLAINMDMVGYNQNGIVELETNKPYENLAKEFARMAAQYTKLSTKITLGAWGSDHVPFLNKNVTSILTIEDWSTKTPCYHQACDKPETLNYDYTLEIAKLNVAAIIEQDGLAR